jgi:hypothetical protein
LPKDLPAEVNKRMHEIIARHNASK